MDYERASQTELLLRYLAATQRNLLRAEARAEQLRAERLTIARTLVHDEHLSIAEVAASMGISRQALHKALQDDPRQ